MKYPKRALPSRVARRNGLRGKAKSPWSRVPLVLTEKNKERMASFETQPNPEILRDMVREAER